jgi:hypothetical protein
MNFLEVSFASLEVGVCAAAAICLFRALSDKKRSRIKAKASPSLITGQALLGVAFVARLAGLLLRQPRAALKIIEITLLFAAASGTLIMLAFLYSKSNSCVQQDR